MSIGIPIKLLHEAEGHIVTLETVTGEVYRGKLIEAEDNMNCQIQNITMTARDGKVTNLEQVFVRGSQIRFLILPDMLKNAPMFRPKSRAKGLATGKPSFRGRSRGRGFGGRGGGPGNVFQRRR
ncbi:small nuclear ribonucleoprotein Sm D3-like [Dysidea avara]|uniref:small nuclear ribonucleoprotein Sm D3-like n=1 Tax=Dysidea avara TaxID=196820 RepID=UPI0033192B25